MEARLLLEDGTFMTGRGFGYTGTTIGEIVFNTGMTGYQEILTDPSYAGQIVTMTYPLVGNYGINDVDIESDSVKVSGFIVKEYCEKPSHWEMTTSLEAYLIQNKIIGLSDVDTRMLTKRIRNIGAMNAIMTTDVNVSMQDLEEQLKNYVFPADIVTKVSTSKILSYPGKEEKGISIGVIDLGLKSGIIKQLLKRGVQVTVYPYDVSFSTLMKGGHQGILFSNGPGDPKECKDTISLAQALRGKVPLFGICLGHQILALSLGADTYKLKFGHRGSNHPVIDLRSNKVFMTSQNHGYAVSVESLTTGMELTHLNVNDDTVEGMSFLADHIISVQFHPEEGPGPTDATVIFNEWIDNLERDV
jgi:carbamoyl-phosphate synthase small subunit